jgi:hypothetical protein
VTKATGRSACSFYPRHQTVFGPSLRRSMRRTKRTGFVAPVITRSHFCLYLTVWDLKCRAHWVRISMWAELWLLTEGNASTIARIPGIVQLTGNCWRQRAQLCIQTDGEYFYTCETQGANSGCCCWYSSSRMWLGVTGRAVSDVSKDRNAFQPKDTASRLHVCLLLMWFRRSCDATYHIMALRKYNVSAFT